MEQKHYYTDEKNAQIVIALLKAHGIKDVIISPGATNDRFVLSAQGDPDFNLYSAVDERHAGYLACGMAQMSGRPVVLNCTGATASRNYMSALTEAYYRKLPILALTCSQHSSHIGQMFPQMTDRIHLPADVVNLSVQCPIPRTAEEERDCVIKVNRALLGLSHRGGGPVHINLETAFCDSYTTEALPRVRKISRITLTDETSWPEINKGEKVVVWIGSHLPFSDAEKNVIRKFVKLTGAVLLGDMTSNMPDALNSALLCSQKGFDLIPEFQNLRPDLIIHIGEISGDYPTFVWLRNRARVWRVNPDGEVRDFLGGLENVFEMPESYFFSHYTKQLNDGSFQATWRQAIDSAEIDADKLPFSDMWLATQLSHRLPTNCILHLGILNPLRCYNAVHPKVARCFCTVGGFGIDGGTSSLLGTALMDSEVMNFGVFGDLSFFYDLNALGSRHLGKNVRILMINNGEGGEFSVPGNISDNPYCGERVHEFIAAKGHYGCQSRELVKHIAEDFGFLYLSASNKGEFDSQIDSFVDANGNQPIIFECFTNVADDRAALDKISEINSIIQHTSVIKSVAREIMPDCVKKVLKAALGR